MITDKEVNERTAPSSDRKNRNISEWKLPLASHMDWNRPRLGKRRNKDEIETEIEKLGKGYYGDSCWKLRMKRYTIKWVWSGLLHDRRRKEESKGKGPPTCNRNELEAPIGFWSHQGTWKWKSRQEPNQDANEEEVIQIHQLKEIGINARNIGEWASLTKEMWEEILQYLNVRELGRVSLTGRSMYELVIHQSYLWKKLFLRKQRKTLDGIQTERRILSLREELLGRGGFQYSRGKDKFLRKKGHWVRTVNITDNDGVRFPGGTDVIEGEISPWDEDGPRVTLSYLERRVWASQEESCQEIKSDLQIKMGKRRPSFPTLDDTEEEISLPNIQYQVALKRLKRLDQNLEIGIQSLNRNDKWKYYLETAWHEEHGENDGRALVWKQREDGIGYAEEEDWWLERGYGMFDHV